MSSTSATYGLLLPHFGRHATRERIRSAAVGAERNGFDSLWVRDHLVFRPHDHEASQIDRTHLDPLTTLALVAGITNRVTLGTASIIPHRHPIHLALLLSCLDHLAGNGRVVAGMGIGAYDHEFEAIGLGGISRRELLEENVAICRQLWTGEEVNHHGKHFNFTGVDIHPVPPSHRIPIWYCGNSRAAVRFAAKHFDGWLPGRMPISVVEERVSYMRQLVGENQMLEVANIPIVSPARTVEEGLDRVNVEGLLRESSSTHGATSSLEPRQTAVALKGAVMAGPPESVQEDVLQLQDAGVRHVIFDLRYRFDDFDECVAQIGEEVLPGLRDSK